MRNNRYLELLCEEQQKQLRAWKACCHRQGHLLRLAEEQLIIQNNALCVYNHKYEQVWPLINRIAKELRKDTVR